MAKIPSCGDDCPESGSRVAAMPPLLRWTWLAVFVALIAILTALGRSHGRALTGPVVSLVDGDTIHVQLRGRIERVRYIGIRAPEIDHPTRGEQRGGREAAEVNRQLVEGRTVRLELDVKGRDEDGRLLAYVYVGDLMVNLELVRRGHAQLMTVPPNVRYLDLFVKLEREALDQRRGLWAEPAARLGVNAGAARHRERRRTAGD